MAVQDDRRELEQLELFDLSQPDSRSRSGTDAIMNLEGRQIEFELKSTTKTSVTTVRDFGMDHIKKWEDKHWLFGFYTPNGNALKFTRYASPTMIMPWIAEKKKYIEVDFNLAKLAAATLSLDDLFDLIGHKNEYCLSDAQRLHKKQLKNAEYIELFDVENGYSQLAMLEILKMRCIYVMERGSTLNNPHIPKNILEGFPRITDQHATKLRALVAQSFNN